MMREMMCPTCGSKDPAKHPAMQFEGEVQICGDPFHETIATLRAERDELREREDALNTRLDWMEGVMTASEKQKSAALEELAQVKELLGEVGRCMKGAPVHPLPKRFVFAEMPTDLAARVANKLEPDERDELRERCSTRMIDEIRQRVEALRGPCDGEVDVRNTVVLEALVILDEYMTPTEPDESEGG